MQFETLNSERMRIDSSGNVGIGTSSIASIGSNHYTLEIDGKNATTAGALRLRSTDDSVDSGFWASNTATYVATISSHPLTFRTNNTERMRIDSSGNVGIGTSSPSANLHVSGSGARKIDITDTGGANTRISTANNNSYVGSTTNHPLLFITNDTERMRIDSSGFAHFNTGGSQAGAGVAGTSIRYTDILKSTSTTGGANQIVFYNPNGAVGSIRTTGSSTAYNTSSDYRLKENVTDITDGIERVKQLNPSRFNFIADADTTVDGFLAHEAATVVPEAVGGEKDAVDADGNPEYQGIDQSKLVPLLTAALQEAITKIEDLEARVAILEGN